MGKYFSFSKDDSCIRIRALLNLINNQKQNHARRPKYSFEGSTRQNRRMGPRKIRNSWCCLSCLQVKQMVHCRARCDGNKGYNFRQDSIGWRGNIPVRTVNLQKLWGGVQFISAVSAGVMEEEEEEPKKEPPQNEKKTTETKEEADDG